MYKYVPVILLLLFSPGAIAQKDSLLQMVFTSRLTDNIVDLTTDNLGNIYIINANNQVKKLNSRGDSVAVYNDVRRYGKISFVDATNPLKVLVFYGDFATVVVLDRLLSVRNTIDLRKQNIFQVQAVTASYDNQLWVFDETQSKIKKLNDQGEVTLETADLRQVFDDVPRPQQIFDRDGQLYLYDSARGLLVFDYYGALKHYYKIPGLAELQIVDKNSIIGRDTTGFVLYQPATLQVQPISIPLPAANYKRLQYRGTKLYVLGNNGRLQVYAQP